MAGDQRFVISVRIIGAVHRDAPKLKAFMISVLWSDESEVIVYRSFQDFKKLHRQLKKRFPQMNPLRRKDRVIPRFKEKAKGSSLPQKGSNRSVQRMKILESYCDKLLSCNQTVTQSSEVIQFFIPKDHDLQSDFSKNSVMILLSEDLPVGGGRATQQPGSSITQPFVTLTYRCVAAYETKDTKNRPFKVAVDEKLDVLIKDPAGWWLVENEDKRLAWFPAPFLELWEGEEEDDAGFQERGALYCAVRSFLAKKADEVSVPIGSVVEVLRKSDNGWWLISFNGKGGYVPSMYLQPYNNPRVGLYSLQRKMHSSTQNLATSREPQASYPRSISEENGPQLDSAGQSRGAPGHLHKAKSLDALSQILSQTQLERDASTSNGRPRCSSNTSFSGLSSSSESSSSLKEEEQQQEQQQPDVSESSPHLSLSHRRGSSASSSSGSVSSKGSETASNGPRVPPRPKTEEILTRCTTMTRKAALATKTRRQIQPESIHSR